MTIDIDEAKVERHAFSLWLSWTLATTLGMLVGYLPAALFINEVDLGFARILVPLLSGLLIGFAQWIVLRDYVTNSRDWILNYAGGWVVGYWLGLWIIQFLSKFPFGSLIGYLLFGIIVAIFQWPVLRREIPHIWSWILANILGWTLGAFVGQLFAASLERSTPTTPITITLVAVTITGLVAGAITALALVWIVRKPERTMY